MSELDDLQQIVAARDQQIASLQRDQQDWRKGVALIASALGDPTDNLSCVRIGEIALNLRVQLEESRQQVKDLQAQIEDVKWEYRTNPKA